MKTLKCPNCGNYVEQLTDKPCFCSRCALKETDRDGHIIYKQYQMLEND